MGKWIYNPDEEATEYLRYSINGDYYEVKIADAQIKYIDESTREYIDIYGYKKVPNKIEEILESCFFLEDQSQEPVYKFSYCELYVHRDSNT